MSSILVTLKSRCDSDFKCSIITFNENKLDGVDLNFYVLIAAFEEKLRGFRQTVW